MDLHTNKSKYSIANNILIILFFLMYFTVSSSYMLPNGDMLRWLVPIILLAIGILSNVKRNKLFYIWPSYFNFLLPTFLFSMITLDYALIYGMAKILSFVLIVAAIFIFLNRDAVSSKQLIVDFSIMGNILNILMVYQLLLLLTSGFNIGGFKGIYNNQNMLASLSLSATACCIWLFNKSSNKVLPILYFISNTIIILATGSRTGLMGLLIILLGMFFITYEFNSLKNKIKIFFWLMVTVITLILISDFLDIPALNRILGDGQTDIYNSTGLSRGEVWQNGLSIFFEKPLLGWGYGSTNYHVFVNNPSNYSGWGMHNSYLVILVENGLIGGLCYLCCFCYCVIQLRYMHKIVYLDANEKKFIKSLILLCVVLLVNAMSESFLFSFGNPMSIPFWFSLITIDVYMKKKLKGH